MYKSVYAASLALLAAPLIRAQIPAVDYAALTNPFSSATNFNVETVRGIVLDQNGFFAINTHASTVVRHTDLTPGWEAEWATVQNPVSLALWNDMGAAKLLVVGGGSWSLVAHDVTTGRIVAHMQLPAEPADIVVDDVANHAYISCQGDNSVVRIDLQTFTQLSRYPVGSQRPRFLYLDDTVSPREVFVAPFLSGNNTTASQPPPWPTQPGPEGSIDRRSVVVDLDGVSGPDLPDEDLYRILASQPWNTPAMPVLHGAGTLLTAHGRSPDGKYWMLSTEAKNADHNTGRSPDHLPSRGRAGFQSGRADPPLPCHEPDHRRWDPNQGW
jgi:hypothetical protein